MSKIISHAPTPEYRTGWTRVFGTNRRNRTVHVSELLDEAMKEIKKQAGEEDSDLTERK